MKKYLIIIVFYIMLLTSCSTINNIERYNDLYSVDYELESGYYEYNLNYYMSEKGINTEAYPYEGSIRPKKGEFNIKGYVSNIAFKDIDQYRQAEYALFFTEYLMNFEIDSYKSPISPTSGYVKTNENGSFINYKDKEKNNKNIYISDKDSMLKFYLPTMLHMPSKVGSFIYYSAKQKYNCNADITQNKVKYSYEIPLDLNKINRFTESIYSNYFVAEILGMASIEEHLNGGLQYIFSHSMDMNIKDNIVTSYKTTIKMTQEDSEFVKGYLEISLSKIKPLEVIIDEDVSDAIDFRFDSNYINEAIYNTVLYDMEMIYCLFPKN